MDASGRSSAREVGPGPDRIRGFDGLRAFALILVFLQHYTLTGRDYETGGHGVWLFFVLSGFLIVRILHAERLRVEAGLATVGQALRRFFWRRTLRIFPPYYLVLVIFTGLALAGMVQDFTAKAAPWHYAYLSNVYFAHVEDRWVGRFGHFWSLAIEEQFYLLAAPALLFAPSRWARGVCLAVVLAALVNDVLLRSVDASAMLLYANSLTNFGALAFGGFLGLSLKAKPQPGRSWIGAAGIAAMIAFIWGFQHIGLFEVRVAALVGIFPFWAAILFSSLAIAGVYLNQDSGFVRLLEWKPLVWFGRISYGFYLYHAVVPRPVTTSLARLFGIDWRPSIPVEAVAGFLAGLALASLSWVLIEKPLLRFKDRPPKLWTRPAAPEAA